MERFSVREFTELNRKTLAWLQDQTMDVRRELMQNHLSVCQLLIHKLLEEAVIEKAGGRYSHDNHHGGRMSRWGSNPGSVRIGDQKLKVEVPPVMDTEEQKAVPLERYERLKEVNAPTEQLIQAVLRGLSTRDDDRVMDYLNESFGWSQSDVRRRFVARTKEQLEECQNRS